MFKEGIEPSLMMNAKTEQFGLIIDRRFKGPFEFGEVELRTAGLRTVVFK